MEKLPCVAYCKPHWGIRKWIPRFCSKVMSSEVENLMLFREELLVSCHWTLVEREHVAMDTK